MELANFELYSSVPHEFKVWLSNSYDKDWALFGHFYAEDSRDVQVFHAKETVFGKYAKVEVLSSHGSEHFCIVSLFRIFGIPEIELIGDDDDEDDAGVVIVDEEAPSAPTAVTTTTALPAPVNIVRFIKEKVGATISKVVGVFSARDQVNVDMNVALNETSLVGNSFRYVALCPGCDVERHRDVYFLLASNFDRLLSALKKNPTLRSSLENGLCQSHGFDHISDSDMAKCVGLRTMEFYSTLFGSSRTIALCNVLAAEKGLSVLATGNQAFGAAGATSDALPAANSGESGKNESSEANHNAQVVDTANQEKEAPVSQQNEDKSSHQSRESNPSVAEGKETTEEAQSAVPKSEDHKTEENKPKSESAVPEDVQSNNSGSEGQPGGSVEAMAAQENKKKDDPVLKDPPKVVLVTPTSDTHITAPPIVSTGSQGGNGHNGGAAGGGGRESAWQKLSNKIKALERNVTLSSGYLEELSVLYKKQIEDLQQSNRQTTEDVGTVDEARREDRKVLDAIADKVEQLTEMARALNTQQETMITWVSNHGTGAGRGTDVIMYAIITFLGCRDIGIFRARQHNQRHPLYLRFLGRKLLLSAPAEAATEASGRGRGD